MVVVEVGADGGGPIGTGTGFTRDAISVTFGFAAAGVVGAAAAPVASGRLSRECWRDEEVSD